MKLYHRVSFFVLVLKLLFFKERIYELIFVKNL